MDDGCGVGFWFGKSPPIDALHGGIGLSQMHRRTPASPIASGPSGYPDVPHRVPRCAYGLYPSQGDFFILWPRKGCQDC
eukprot:1198634-Pyramimonas_sp.AAC.1